MPSRPPRTFGQKSRLWFRGARIIGWLFLFALVYVAVYLNQVGLPEFLKRPLLRQLHQRGVELEFTRLRLVWFAGIVAENVRFGGGLSDISPQLSARQAELDLNWRQMLRGRLQVEAVGLRNGRFAWPVVESNAPPRTLVVRNLQAWLRLLPGDEWALDDFRAHFAGVRVALSGTITNASALREWSVVRGSIEGKPARSAPGTARRRLRGIAETIRQLSSATPPELRLVVTGDARDPQTFSVRLTLTAPEAETPWGGFSNGLLNARVFAATATTPSRAEIVIEATEAKTSWGSAHQFGLELKFDSVPDRQDLVSGTVTIRAELLQTPWANASNAVFTANWIHALTNAIPQSGQGELRLTRPSTRWGFSESARLGASLTAATNPPPSGAHWAWWTNLLPYQLTWEAEVSEPQSEMFAARHAACAGHWQAPALVVTNLHARLRWSELNAQLHLDVSTRTADFDLNSRFGARELEPWLSPAARKYVDLCKWAEPAWMNAAGSIILPAWAQQLPDWRRDVWPTLALAGKVGVTNASILGLVTDSLRSDFNCTNQVWQLSDFALRLPEGELQGCYGVDLRTREFNARIRSTAAPEALRPLLSTDEQRYLDFVTFTAPPTIEAEAWGRLDDLRQLGLRGDIAATNFTFRDAPISTFTSGLAYSNQLLEAFEPRIWRGTQHLRAVGVAADFAAERVHLTNAFSTDDPMVVTRAIGPKTAEAIEPYCFASPPTVHLDGTVPMRGNAGADLRMEVAGGPFNWWKFQAPEISGTVHWREDIVTLTNMDVSFYGGRAEGWGVFDTSAAQGTDCRFTLTTSNADFRGLMADLTTPTNRLEGVLDATLTITGANSADWRSWNGHGRAQLRDGLIWAIPIFGVMSGPLDGIIPGLGSSRFNSGSADFILTNGVVVSDNLEWRAPAMRLQYVTTVDLEGTVNGTVQAELLRDTWLVGRIVSLALWPISKVLEFKVTGTLNQPKVEPLYIPKLLTTPLRPFQTLKDAIGVEPGQSKPPSPAPPSSP